MSTIDVQLSCRVHDSFRVQQVIGMFDLPCCERLSERFIVELPDESEEWQIGMIVGPSGSGKTSVARHAYGPNLYTSAQWPADRALIDCFGDHPISQITRMLTAVGFSSPPAWIKPYAVLSNGERFRCDLARALLNATSAQTASKVPLLVFDEFTSVVDRTVARVGSMAVSNALRSGKIMRRFVAVTCHYDVVPWLAPDWVLDMSSGTLARGRLRRPSLSLTLGRCDASAWPMFQRHHYLTGSLHRSAKCFIACVENRPAAFCAVISFPHPIRPGWREHRTVCLPDFQGIGIGSTLAEWVASLFIATGKPYFSTSGHPAVIRHRIKSPHWKMCRKPGMVSAMGASGIKKTGQAAALSMGRFTAGFEYVGPPREAEARAMGVI